MYKKYKNFPRKPSDDSNVMYEKGLEAGLLGPLTDLITTFVGSNITSNLMPSYQQFTQQSFVSPNRGIVVAKSNYVNMKHELLRQRQIYWDSEFAADRIEMPNSIRGITWKRPFEICPNPQLFTQGISRFDINQGKLGDCWLLAAMACLVIHKNLFHQVVPLDQSFNKGDYCGMFRFHFWFFGQWIEVIIDDLLPTINNELVLMRSKDSCEFWSALLEKAYAKLYGSYKNLSGGFTSEAMVDFTAGITENIILRQNQSLSRDIRRIDELFFRLLHAYSQQSLMSCSKEGGFESRDVSGLVSRHAYSITAVCLVNTNGLGQARLIRLRNPWGNETEWNGPWSDGSQEWRMIHPNELQRLQILNRDDGEFWMSFPDFVNQFDKMEICYVGPQCMEELGQMKKRERTQKKIWELKMFYGGWRRGINAGGSKKYNTYWNNPQFQLTINEPDDGSQDGTGTVIIGLMQKSLRFYDQDFLTIGYSVYMRQQTMQGPMQAFQSNREVASSGTYVNQREVSGIYKLVPGPYIIVPATYDQNVDGDFLIRIFSVKRADAIVIDQEIKCDALTTLYPNLSNKDKPQTSNTFQFDPKYINDIFIKYAGPSKTMDATQLQTVFNNELSKEKSYGYFSIMTVQSFFYLMKKGYNDRIDQNEFHHIWWYLLQWKDLFLKYDVNKNGFLESYELRNALSQSGIQINNFIFEKLVTLYSSSTQDCSICFDNYVRCCAQLKSIFDQYQLLKNTPQYKSQKISLEQFMDHCLRSIAK